MSAVTLHRPGPHPTPLSWRREFLICPIMRIREAFRYFWPSQVNQLIRFVQPVIRRGFNRKQSQFGLLPGDFHEWGGNMIENHDYIFNILGGVGSLISITALWGWGLTSRYLVHSRLALTNRLWLWQLRIVMGLIGVVAAITIFHNNPDTDNLLKLLTSRDPSYIAWNLRGLFLGIAGGLAIFAGRSNSDYPDDAYDEARAQWRILVAAIMYVCIVTSGTCYVLLGIVIGVPIIIATGSLIILLGIFAKTFCQKFPRASRALLCIYGSALGLISLAHEGILAQFLVRDSIFMITVLIVLADIYILRSPENPFEYRSEDRLAVSLIKMTARHIRSLSIRWHSLLFVISFLISFDTFNTENKNLLPHSIESTGHQIGYLWYFLRSPVTFFLEFLMLGTVLYWLKSARAVLYGTVELVVAAISMWFGLHKLVNEENIKALLTGRYNAELSNFLLIVGGLYVMVRGLDNIGKGIEKQYTTLSKLWKGIFDTRWLSRDSRRQGKNEVRMALTELAKM